MVIELILRMMIRLPSSSTSPVVPAGTTTVVVGTSTMAGPGNDVARAQFAVVVDRRWSTKPARASRQTGRVPMCAAAGSDRRRGTTGSAGMKGSTPMPRTR